MKTKWKMENGKAGTPSGSVKIRLRVGDEVLVTAGKDKGRKGKIDKVFPLEGRVRVAGLNIYKKTRKGVGEKKGGIMEIARPLPTASVALVCPNCGKGTRVAYKVTKTGEKLRSCVKCKRIIESKKEGK